MYKVFVNNAAIHLSTQSFISEEFTSIPIRKANIVEIILQLQEDPSLKFHLFHRKEEKLLKILHKKLPVVVAGGGKVYNEANKILFIKRNGFWDLPKGKMEKGESIEETSVREVEEETGGKNIKITRFLMKTYHVYKRNGKFKLKLTYWFEMKTDFIGPLYPQIEESITKVKWKSPVSTTKALKNTYGTITQLFPREYLVKKSSLKLVKI